MVATKNVGETAESEKRLVALINGAEPKDEDEKEIAEQIKEIIKKGQITYIPTSL